MKWLKEKHQQKKISIHSMWESTFKWKKSRKEFFMSKAKSLLMCGMLPTVKNRPLNLCVSLVVNYFFSQICWFVRFRDCCELLIEIKARRLIKWETTAHTMCRHFRNISIFIVHMEFPSTNDERFSTMGRTPWAIIYSFKQNKCKRNTH